MSEAPPPRPNPAPAHAAREADALGGSILIVDDNQQNLELLQAYLEEMDCDLRAAHDGVEALAEVEKRQPDIILLDVMMPKMSGYQACVKLKNNPATRDIPIIMVTALNEVADAERAVESGADDFLTKPVSRQELVTKVKALLSLRQVRKQTDRTMEQLRKLKGRG